MKIQLAIFGLLAFLALACGSSRKAAGDGAALEQLFQWMTGSFSSAEQAARDSAYYDISLHMYPIWKEKGRWLYVEQAVGSMQDRPYRQRVYQVEQLDANTFRSAVYTLPDEAAFVGAWAAPGRFDALTPDQLVLREGCAVILKRQADGSFSGGTEGKGCESTLRGASYATSRVTIREGAIDSWDQGFNTAGEQVWGAVKGGYEFRRLR